MVSSPILQAAGSLPVSWYAKVTGWQDVVRISMLHLEFFRFCQGHPEFVSVPAAWAAFWESTPANPAVLRGVVAAFAEGEGLTLLEAMSVLQSSAALMLGVSEALGELSIAALAQLKREFIRVSRPDLADLVGED